MIATLATCTDPLLLIDGAPEPLRADAEHLERQHRALLDHADGLRRAHPTLWTGTAAEGWAGRRAQYVTTVETVSQIHAVVAGALQQHADTVEWARGRAEVAIALYARGCELRDAEALTCTVAAPLGGRPRATATATAGVGTDAGAGHRALAEQVLASARQRVDTSARAAADLLDDLSADLPDGRWHLGDFLRGMWSWVTGIASLAWELSGVRLMIDPAGVERDATALVDGVTATWDGLTDDPLTTGAGLLQTDLLRDRPGEWWGQLAPDAAMSVLGGGAGWATRGVRAARLGEEVGSAAAVGAAGSRWWDPAARARWLEDLKSNPANRQRQTSRAPWAVHQRAVTGTDLETRLTSGDLAIWADDVVLDGDAVAAVEVKHTGTPGNSPYDGTASAFGESVVLVKFDNELERYAAVIADESNPVSRLRLSASDQASAEFLGTRARAILGPDIDLDVVINEG